MEKRKETRNRIFNTIWMVWLEVAAIWRPNASFTKVATEYKSLLAKNDRIHSIYKLKSSVNNYLKTCYA